MAELEQINTIKPEEKEIDRTEIEQALKPNGFLANEENIKNLKRQLDGTTERDELVVSLESCLHTELDNILQKDAWTGNDIQIVNLWNMLLGEKEEEKLKKIQEKLEEKITSISSKVNKKIGKNEYGNTNYYEKQEIQLVQLWANVSFGENVSLDGERGNLFYSSQNTENQKLTNLYVYKQEFITRQEVIDARKDFKMKEFDQLLAIPTLQELLGTLGSVEKQNQVFGKFLDFVLKIRVAGMFFENQIGSESILPVLNYMINAENYKDVTVEEYFKEIKENLKETIDLKKSIVQGGYKTMYEYYENMAKKHNTTSIDQLPEKSQKEFLKVGYTTLGEYYEDMLLSISEEPQKSMSVTDYFKEQENMLNNLIELQGSITFSTMGEYFQNTSELLMSTIADTNKINIKNNTILFKKQETDRIEEEIEQLELQLKNYSSEEQYKGGSISSEMLDIPDMPREYEETNPACTTAVCVNKKNIDYALHSLNATNEEKAQYLKEHGYETLENDIQSDRLFTPRGKIQIQILELKLQLYEVHKNQSYLDDFYMYIQKVFSDEDIKTFFTLKTDNVNCKITKDILQYGVSYDAFKKRTDELSGWINHVGQTYEEFIEIRDTNDLLTRINGKVMKVVDGGMQPSYRMHPDGYVYQVGDERRMQVTILRGGEEVIETISMPKGFDIATFNANIKSLPKNQYITDYPLSSEFPFAIVKYEENGDVNLYACKSVSDVTPGKLIKNISSAAIEKTNTYNKTVVDMAQDYETNQALSILLDFAKDFDGIWGTYEKFTGTEEVEKQSISNEEADEVLNRAVDFQYNKLEKYENSVPLLKVLLEKLDSGSANQELSGMFGEQRAFLADMINMFESGSLRQCIELLGNVESNDEGREKVRIWLRDNLVQTLFAIAGAVLAIVLAAPSGTASIRAYIGGMSLFTAAVGAIGGMIGSRIGQLTNEGIQNAFFAKTVNGYTIEYDNPTDVELFMTGQMKTGDFFKGLASEFIIGTITTFGFMKAGQMIGKGLVQAGIKEVNIFRPSAQLSRFMQASKKIIFPNTNMIANNATKSFGRAFSREFGEETFEESLETVGEKIHPVLGGIITIINCLSGPNAGKLFKKYNVGGGLTNIEENKIIQQMTYNANDITELEEYFTSTEQGYTKIVSDGKVRFEKPIIENDAVTTKSGKKLDTHVIEFVYSNASSFMNNSADFFAQYGMNINHQSTNNEVIVYSVAQLNAFAAAVTVGGLGTVTINPDGSAKFNSGKEVIHIVPSKTFSLGGVNRETESKVANNSSNESENVNVPTTPSDIQQNITEIVNNVEDLIEEVEDNQNMLENDMDIEQMTDAEQMTLSQKIKTKIGMFAISLNGKTEADVLHDIGTYMFNNVKHFLHECKHVFKTQLVDVYKSYVQMKKSIGKPGDVEYQKVFQAKIKERGINLTKLVGVTALTKIGIDPYLFTWSGHLIADQLQKHIPFFDKLFGLSFETMNTLYSRKKGKNTMYNPQTVIENSLLDPNERRQKIAEELRLDASDIKNQPLLNALQEAHEVGQDGPGKNPEYSPGVYNYTTEQIRQKMEILKPFIENGSITLEQVRMLFERGYLGKNSVKVEVNQDVVSDGSDVEVIGLENNFIVDGKNLLDQIKSPEVKQEMLTIMQENIDNGMLDIENGKAYVEVNGQKVESQLFNETMKNFGKEQAILTRLQVRTQNFKNRFGDWQNNPNNINKQAIDNNGEPMVFYHGTTKVFNQFKKNVDKNFESVQNTKDWIFFTSDYDFARDSYAKLQQNKFNGVLIHNQDIWITKDKEFDTYEEYFQDMASNWNKFIESIGTSKVEIIKIGSVEFVSYDGQRIGGDDGFTVDIVKRVQSGEMSFTKGSHNFKFNGSQEFNINDIYVPKNNFEGLILPCFLKGEKVSVDNTNPNDTDAVRMDNSFDRAIVKDENADYIVAIEEWGGLNVGVRNSNQIKSAIDNDGYFNDVAPKFRGETKSTVDPEIVKVNANLSPEARIVKAKELVGNITPTQEQAILEAHNQDGTIYNLNFSQLKARVEILSKPMLDANGEVVMDASGKPKQLFTSEQIRVLIENGICGQAEAVVLDTNQDGVFDGSDIEMVGNNQQLLTNELAQTNPTRYQEILIEKLSADPAYKGILDAMEITGTKIIVNPSLATRGGYDQSANSIEINPTRENRNDGSLWGEGGYGTLSGDQLTLAVVGHEMHHFLYQNSLQLNRHNSANSVMEKIVNGEKDSDDAYEEFILNIHNKLKLHPGKSFVYHTNTVEGIEVYRSNMKRDAEGKTEFDAEGKTIPIKELNDYFVAEENVIELSRLYSQGQLDSYLQYLVDTEQSILDEKGLQKITEEEKAEISMYIEVLVDGAKNELNVMLNTKDVEIINTPTTDNIEEIIAAEKEKLEKFMEENEFDETDPEQKKEKEKHEKTLESYQKALELITNVKTKYSKKLLDIEEKLKLDPTNKKLLAEKEKYQKIQSMLENEIVINKKMTVIDTIKVKLNITKTNINKLWIKLKGAVSGDKINIQNKIDGLTEKAKKLQLELDAHEKDIQSIFEETYQGIRDMKGLTDQEMLELGKIYNEYILKPIGFRIIDFSATFGTDVLLDKNGNTLGIDTEIVNAAERSNAGLDTETVAMMKLGLYEFTENATMADVDAKIENMLESVKNPAEKEVLSKLRASMKSKVNDGRLLPSEKALIFAHSMAFVSDYKLAFKDKTASDVLLLVEANQNKLIHQHVQDKSYLTGSAHNILHILRGNMDMAENFMQSMSPMERVLTRQIIIDHDIGYTSMFNKYLNESLKKGNFKYFDATKDHPIRSTLYVEENSEWYEHNFGKEEYNIIKNGILSHSSPKTTNLPSKKYNGETRPDIIYGVTSVVDCAAASADYKTAFLFGQPEIVTQFKLVYEAMEQGDISTAEKSFVKIVEIINASNIDIELKTALLNAVDSMHLKPDSDGSIPFQKKLNELRNMAVEEIIQEKNSMLKKANKDNDPKNLKKVIDKFNKANGTDYETIVQLEGATDEQIKKYAMFDYIDGIVSFPYQKYLAQYGVRVAKTLNDVYEIGEERGVIRVNFELSGKTFKSLVEMGGVEFALSSFIKVCEDFNIDKNSPEMQKLIANIEKAITTGNMEKTLTQIYRDTRVELLGKNNELVSLNFRGESYSDIDQMIEMQVQVNESINKTTENMENAFKELEINKELDQRKVLVADMKSYVADIVDVVGDKTYVVEGLTLPEYAIAIQNKLDTYFIIEGDISQDHIKEVLTDIDNIATAGYFPSLFTKIKG